MNPTYNIYRRLSGNALAWVERFNQLEDATKHVVELRATLPGNYVIYDVRLRTLVREWTA
jgi:hypothetical protein